MVELLCVGFYLFEVEDKMAELPCVGFYLFGVEEVKMEAHHHGGGSLGWRTRWRSSLLEVSTYLGWRTRWRSSLV